MEARPYKFLVQAVVQQLDADGNVVGELPVGGPQGDPVVLFGCKALEEWAIKFPVTLDQAVNGSADQAEHVHDLPIYRDTGG